MSVSLNTRAALIKNSIGIFGSRFLTTIVSLIAIPVVIGKLGIDGYGSWESIIAFSALCNIFQSTISGTTLWLVSNTHGLNDHESTQEYIRIATFVFAVIFAAVVPLVWFSRHIIAEFLQVPASYLLTAEIVLPLIVTLVLLGTITEIIGALIGGYQKAGATNMVQALATVSNTATIVASLYLGLGFWSLPIGYVFGFAVSMVGLLSVANNIVGRLSLLPKAPSAETVKQFIPYASFLLLGAVSIALRDQTDKIILTSVASPVWTGSYGIAARLAGIVTIICSFFYVPAIAAAGSLNSAKNMDGISKLYSDVVVILAFLVGIFVTLIGGLHDRIIYLWIGKVVPEATSIIYFLLVGNTSAVILTGAGSSICKGLGIIRIESIYIILGIIINIILKLVLVPSVGAIGAVASSALSWALSAIFFVVLLHRYTQLPVLTTMKAIKTLIIIFCCVCLARYICFLYPIRESRLDVLVSTVVMSVLLSLVFVMMMFLLKVINPSTIKNYMLSRQLL